MKIWILAALGLYLVQCMLGPVARWLVGKNGSVIDALGPRDTQPPQSVIGARFERALANMQEALILFLPLAILLQVNGTPTPIALQGAQVFVVARLLYVAAYASGVFGLRSLVWMAGHAGLAMMAASLVASS